LFITPRHPVQFDGTRNDGLSFTPYFAAVSLVATCHYIFQDHQRYDRRGMAST
jgi:hypothetical protein